MKLVLEVEFLTGECRAAVGPASDAPDWPPQPDRMFSALVAAWGARGQHGPEKDALEWLERQPVPAIHASACDARTTPDVFVPPNDMAASKAGNTYLKVLPQRRPRQPRRFPVAKPHSPHMAFVWSATPSAEILVRLDAIARDVAYLGHSASLVRCRIVCREFAGATRPARNRVYPGRLAELVRAHALNPVRPDLPSAASNLERAEDAPTPRHSVLVLEALDDKPDLRVAPLICREIRRALMSGYRRAFGSDQIPEVVSGHAPSGSPTTAPHLVIAPLAYVGYQHADGLVRGFALISPSATDLVASSQFRAAFAEISSYHAHDERRILELGGKALREKVRLSPAGATNLRSLSVDVYRGPSKVWASVTPIVLDRHLKRHDDREMRELVVRACEHAGLPRVDPANLQVGKHAALAGVPPARRLAGAPPWTGWQVPRSLATRWLTHAVVDFGREVEGPVILGAGRFTGLGLLRPVEA